MGIDIYARWRGQTDGQLGYLRESYHGAPYATKFLLREAFVDHHEEYVKDLGVPIPAAYMRARLPRALALAVEREQRVYGNAIDEHHPVAQSFTDFVELCEAKEKVTGERCYIYAAY